MNNGISYKNFKTGEEKQAVDLVLSVFDAFVAPGFSEDGVDEFKKYVNAEAVHERLNNTSFIVVAKTGDRIIGVIEIRDNSHIAMLFVDSTFQRKGIGKGLFEHAKAMCFTKDPDLERFTVNAAPNSVSAYENMGFAPTDDERMHNGIRFVPMEYKCMNRHK